MVTSPAAEIVEHDSSTTSASLRTMQRVQLHWLGTAHRTRPIDSTDDRPFCGYHWILPALPMTYVDLRESDQPTPARLKRIAAPVDPRSSDRLADRTLKPRSRAA